MVPGSKLLLTSVQNIPHYWKGISLWMSKKKKKEIPDSQSSVESGTTAGVGCGWRSRFSSIMAWLASDI